MLFTILLLAFLISGCTRYRVIVDSLKDDSLYTGNNYILLSSIKDVDTNDLQFKEFSKYVIRALALKGYRQVGNIEQADMAVFLSYGIGQPEKEYYSYSVPIYGETGGGISTFNATTSGSKGYSSTSGTIYTPPTYGIVGSSTVTGSTSTYFRWLVIESVNLNEFKKNQKVVPTCKTIITSRGSMGDLRKVFPIMVGAGADYFCDDTAGQIKIDLNENDKRVQRIR